MGSLFVPVCLSPQKKYVRSGLKIDDFGSHIGSKMVSIDCASFVLVCASLPNVKAPSFLTLHKKYVRGAGKIC